MEDTANAKKFPMKNLDWIFNNFLGFAVWNLEFSKK